MSAPSIVQRLLRAPRLWFGFGEPVRRLEYAASGFFLAALKYVLDAAVYLVGTGRTWPLSAYWSPSFQTRFPPQDAMEDWVPWALAVLLVPFVWVGVSMTLRRCRDAGLHFGWSLLFFVPALNVVFLVGLCLLPTRAAADAGTSASEAQLAEGARRRAWLLAVGLGASVGFGMMLVSAVFLREYGLALFVGSPFVMGLVSAYTFNRRVDAGHAASIALANATLLACALTLMLVALEGLGCVLMAYPLAAILAGLGALLGRARALSDRSNRPAVAAMVFMLPVMSLGDAARPAPEPREILTSIEIEASREVVWEHVIGFPELPPPSAFWRRSGLAYPVGARIDGEGVGAVRECNFSTGAFVEPITAWEPPSRLAFDVSSQPAPMQELSPYPQVLAPHLVDGLVSHRGEFRLVALPGGRTRLEGRTWYSMNMEPAFYWAAWSNRVIHAIHGSVLEHVRGLSEGDG